MNYGPCGATLQSSAPQFRGTFGFSVRVDAGAAALRAPR